MRYLVLFFALCFITSGAYAKKTHPFPPGHETLMNFIEEMNEQDPDSVLSHNQQPKTNEIARLEYYLNAIHTLVADFTQIAPDGTSSSGMFFLSRPGKLRWQYNPPTPILIVANGNSISHFDYELNQLSHTSLDNSLAGFLTRRTISFKDDVIVKQYTKAAGIKRLTLVQKDRPEEGELVLIFGDQPLELKKMEITDSNKQVTTVAFSNLQLGVELSKDLFVINKTTFFNPNRR